MAQRSWCCDYRLAWLGPGNRTARKKCKRCCESPAKTLHGEGCHSVYYRWTYDRKQIADFARGRIYHPFEGRVVRIPKESNLGFARQSYAGGEISTTGGFQDQPSRLFLRPRYECSSGTCLIAKSSDEVLSSTSPIRRTTLPNNREAQDAMVGRRERRNSPWSQPGLFQNANATHD